MERETLKSRLGFILLSAGCAIGIGNVWKFPYMAGQGGGGAFVLFYLVFLVIMGLPIMTMEFAVGRASRKSPVRAYQALEAEGQKWHIHGYFCLAGCYLLMMFYTTVAGWMLHYFYLTAAGRLANVDTEQVAQAFSDILADPVVMAFWMLVTVAFCIFVCAMGLQNGLERVTKVMMIALGVDQTSGPSLIFITLPNIFSHMAGGRLWGSLFFLFMAFAALSTVLAVFENIICCGMELTGCTRKKSALVNLLLISALSMPCVLGYNVWAWDGFAVFGGAVLDFEDFLVSNLLLPIGSLIYLLFCVSKRGWGWDNYFSEVNSGAGLKMPKWTRSYLTYGLPVIVLFLFVVGLYDKFAV